MTVREDGYSYLELNDDNDTMLLAVPYGITEFRGTIPMEDDSEKTVTVIGDGVFADSYALRWVILPEETKAIGYQAFKDCANLEGVLIDSRDVFLLCNEAFDTCTTLRFVASNAFKMLLEDTDLELPSNDVWRIYGFLLCPPMVAIDSQYNDGNWCAVDGVETYDLVDCGGTYVLYGADEEGDDWIALRSGKTIGGEVTLPGSTEMIYQEAFQDARTANDTFFTVNWEELENLGMIWRSAFKGSDLGEDLVLPVDLELQTYAFGGCTKIKTVVLPGSTPAEGIRMGQEVFAGCTALREVSLGTMNTYDGLDGTTFGNCTSLERINFLSRQAPKLISGEGGLLYYFQYDQELAGNLTITVPEGTEEDYIRAWRYAMAGYYASEYKSAYQAMIDGVAQKLSEELFWSGEFRDPTDEEIMAEVNRLLLESENRLRTLMGLPTVEAVQRAYRYTVDDDGMVTLAAAHHIGDYTDLSAAEMELPDDWALDYVAADAFRESPELRVVSVPETLAGFHSNAFRGLEFDESDPTDGLIIYLNEKIFDLVPEGEGVPFTFGVDEDRVRVVSLPLLNGDDDISYYVQFWTLPMAGYSSIDTMRAAIAAELTADGEAPDDETVQAELEACLLEAENRVRRLLDWEETEELTLVIPEEPVRPGELPDAVLPTPTDPENPDETEEPEEQPTGENPDGDTPKGEDDKTDGQTPADETDETEQEEQEETPA